jgi:hypothetical protein
MTEIQINREWPSTSDFAYQFETALVDNDILLESGDLTPHIKIKFGLKGTTKKGADHYYHGFDWVYIPIFNLPKIEETLRRATNALRNAAHVEEDSFEPLALELLQAKIFEGIILEIIADYSRQIGTYIFKAMSRKTLGNHMKEFAWASRLMMDVEAYSMMSQTHHGLSARNVLHTALHQGTHPRRFRASCSLRSP